MKTDEWSMILKQATDDTHGIWETWPLQVLHELKPAENKNEIVMESTMDEAYEKHFQMVIASVVAFVFDL